MSAAEVSWVPLHSSPEAVFKTDGRNIFQALLSKADVRQRMRDIAGTSRRVMGRAVKSNDLLQHLVRSVQGMADSCGNVEHLARKLRGPGPGTRAGSQAVPPFFISRNSACSKIRSRRNVSDRYARSIAPSCFGSSAGGNCHQLWTNGNQPDK